MKKLFTLIIVASLALTIQAQTLNFEAAADGATVFHENGIRWTITGGGAVVGAGNGGGGQSAEIYLAHGDLLWNRDITIDKFYMAAENGNMNNIDVIFYDKNNTIILQTLLYVAADVDDTDWSLIDAKVLMLGAGMGYNPIPDVRRIAFNAPGSGFSLYIDDMTYDGVNPPPYVSTWLGHTTDWHTKSNWDNTLVPTRDYHVIIPTSPTGGNFPIVTAGTDAECKDIDVETGASITINGNLDTTLGN